MAWNRYWHHRGAAISTVVMAILSIIVILAPFTARYGVNEQVLHISEGNNVFLPPSKLAWFGTDDIGRDIYSRLIWGIRTSMFIGVASALLSVVFGTAAGALAGLRGGKFDDIMMRVTDIFLAFPFLVVVIIMRQFLGNISWLEPVLGPQTSIRFIIWLFAIFGWMGVARLVRSQVLVLKEREFIEAARAVGGSNLRIVVSHLLPNSIGPILVALTISVIGAIVGESTLAFFGLGPQPGSGGTSLGKLIELSKEGAKQGNWWLVAFPCGALVVLAIGINFIGDGLRDALDPKLDAGN
ncbi:MAG: peptide/nickel transport system permease protein [Acidimicrobiaceae bacterium]|jgi:ABC-type dipeptide/oligopeptide/nickel transport system permease subunit|nr:MAG: peptide/nickel transport system permease protein [Acidimicrobiaceae bacterium]